MPDTEARIAALTDKTLLVLDDDNALRTRLDAMLVREGRMDLATACFGFLPHRAALDLAGWEDNDIFAHM